MAARCPSCGSEMPDGMRFCGACGTPLATAPQQQPQPQRERRLVSILFGDLVGFTTFSESRDAEDVRDVLDQYFAVARKILGDYGGTIEKFIGDAVMAVWGAPLAREDDAERAVRAGLELAAAVTALGRRLAIPELTLRVGVLTGEAAVQIGAVHEGMVTGDAVNTAARIQSIADPGTVLVDDTTRLASERVIAFAAAGDQMVKGKRAPVRVWRALEGHDGVDVAAGAGSVEPPLVGRAEQLETLGAVLARLLEPGAGVRVVTVSGEAGIGKSRLGRELEERADRSAPIRWNTGRSLAFGEGSGLSALAEIVRATAGIRRSDAPSRRRALVDRLLRALFDDGAAEREMVARAVYRLLDLDDGRAVIEQGELFAAWRRLFERLARDGPVVLAFEELQRADQALLDFIAHLRDWSRAPILVLAFSRPDPRLADLPEQIELRRLSDAEMEALVAGAVEGAPGELRAAILAEGGGIPLYAVETLRALADRGVLGVAGTRYVVRRAVSEISIPPTIRALVSSRLDLLDGDERRVLTAGAVLGETFSAGAAAALAGLADEETRALLDALVARVLLGRDRDPRSPLRGRYTFLQGVVRRVALAGLSRRERKRLHLAAVEHLSSDSAAEPELAAVLAGHLLAAEEADPHADDADSIRQRAREVLQAAADRAAAVGAFTEALTNFDRAAEWASDGFERATILERAGVVAYRSGNMDGAVTRLRNAQEAYGEAGCRRDQLRARAEELRALRYVASPVELLPALRELDAALADEHDSVKALASNLLAYTMYQCGEHRQALAAAERAQAIAEECGDEGELVHALSGQGGALQELDRPDEAVALIRRSVELARQHDARRLAPELANLAVSLTSIGRHRESVDRARESILAAEKSGERFYERYARLVLGRALCSLGEWQAAVMQIESVKADVPPAMAGMAFAPLAVVAQGRGDDERARALVAEYDVLRGEAASDLSESDFRILRGAILAVEDAELAQLIAGAQTADYAEWAGWLSPIIDRIVAVPAAGPLETALESLRGPGEFKRTPPVVAQAKRLEAHLAARAGGRRRAAEHWTEAERLTTLCGQAFERAVIALERAEHGHDEGAIELARATFERLEAGPWVARAAQLG